MSNESSNKTWAAVFGENKPLLWVVSLAIIFFVGLAFWRGGVNLEAWGLKVRVDQTPQPTGTTQPVAQDSPVVKQMPNPVPTTPSDSRQPKPTQPNTFPFTGIVVDAQTGQPLGGVKVFCNGQSALTTEGGRFQIDLPKDPGTAQQNVTLSKGSITPPLFQQPNGTTYIFDQKQ